MPKLTSVILLVVLSLLISPNLLAATPGGDDLFPVWSPNGRQILFISTRDGNEEIYVMDADGRNVHNVSQSPFSDVTAAWSPDSQRIVFIRVEGQHEALYLVNADGSNLRLLREPMAHIIHLEWSADGTAILFMTQPDGTTSDLYLIEPDGEHARLITHLDGRFSWPRWSPDSQRIASSPNSPDQDQVQLQVITRAGGTAVNLLENYRSVHESCCWLAWNWSPDSQHIAFAVLGDDSIYLVDAETSIIRHLADVDGQVRYLAWSPDGQQIIFTMSDIPGDEFEGGQHGLFVLDATDGTVRRIDNAPWLYFYLAPDGKQIFPFMFGADDVPIFQVDGRLTTIKLNYTGYYEFAWSPDSRFIAGSVCVEDDADIYLVDVEKATTQNLTSTDSFTGEALPSMCNGAG